jgi:hypothetical protein
MDNPEKLATLSTQDTGRRQTKNTKQKPKNDDEYRQPNPMLTNIVEGIFLYVCLHHINLMRSMFLILPRSNNNSYNISVLDQLHETC